MAAGTEAASEDGRLPALVMLATEPLHKDELKDVEIREVPREGVGYFSG